MSATNLRSRRPDSVTVWFVADEQVGLDVRWGGRLGDRRATAAHERLRTAGHPVSIARDELGWRVRLCPLAPSAVPEIVGNLLVVP